MKKFLTAVIIMQFSIVLFAQVKDYYSPQIVKVSLDGKAIYVLERTAKQVVKLNPEEEKIEKVYPFKELGMDMILNKNCDKIFVTCGEGFGNLTIFEEKTGKSTVHNVGHSPFAPTLSIDEKTLYIANRFSDKVSAWKLPEMTFITDVKVTREPIAMVLDKTGKFLFVANHLPDGRANVQRMTSHIDVISTESNKIVKSIQLPNGAIDLRAIAITNDGKWILVPSIFARFQVPTNQIERGWISTNALNLINVEKQELYQTVLLDDVELGAANPWGVTSSKDDKLVFVAHNATHEISVINFEKLLEKLKKAPVRKENQALEDYESLTTNPANDLTYLAGIRKRVRLDGIGPRGIAVFDTNLYVAQYFSDDVGVVDFSDTSEPVVYNISLGPKKEMDSVRKGEMYFNDAEICFQQWLTCSTCHPDARTDAVNWDLMNDGIGNPKSTKSMLFSPQTPPTMITGIRKDSKMCVRAGIQYIQFTTPDEERSQTIDDYLLSLQPIPSPYLVNGELSEKAKRGQKVFNEAQCIVCHSGKYYTNLQKYQVGSAEDDPIEKKTEFDTPTLIELYRSRPYLYNGKAKDLKETFKEFNKEDKHGITSSLSDAELEDLEEFLLSL